MLFFFVQNKFLFKIKRYELKEDVRQSMYDYANEWVQAVGTTHKFRGGATPNLSDLVNFFFFLNFI